MALPQITSFSKGLVTQRNVLDTPISFAGANAVPHYDTLMDGLNVEISNLQTIRRRPGYSPFGSGYLNGSEIPLNVSAFKNLDGTIRVIVDTNLRVASYDGTVFSTIYTKNSGASYGDFAVLGNRSYFADTQSNFKWDGTTLSQWGIATPLMPPNITFQPLLYSTFITTEEFTPTDVFQGAITLQINKGTIQTANIPANSALQDIVNVLNGGTQNPVTVTLSSGTTSDYVQTNSGNDNQNSNTGSGSTTTAPQGYYSSITYNIASGSLNGAFAVGSNVTITGMSDSALNTTGSITSLGTNYFVVNYYLDTQHSGTGGSASATPPAVNFNVTASIVNGPTTGKKRVKIVSNTLGPDGALTLTSSVVDTTNNIAGFQFEVGDGIAVLAPGIFYAWRFVYKNSSTGHISTASDPTPQIISQSIAGTATLTGAGSTDTQVDYIEIYRTVDGGSTYFYSGQVANTAVWTYVDSVPDSSLNTTIIAPIDNANDPPQAGAADPVFHTDRIWYHVDNILYYTAGPDATNGVGAEASPPANYIPSYPGRIVKKISTTNGLLIFLEDDLHIVTGLDSASYRSQLLATGLGIKNELAVVADGQNIYVYTTKQQLYELVPSKTTEIGFAIGDKLKTSFPSTTSSLTLHRGSSTDYALYISNGTDSVFRYFVDGNSWSPVAQPAMGVSVQRSLEIAPGDVRLMSLTPNKGSQVYFRDTSSFLDANTPYKAFFTLGVLTLAQIGLNPVGINNVIANFSGAGTVPALSLLPEEISGTFTTINNPISDPPNYPAGKTLVSRRWYLASTDQAFNQLMRYVQVRFDFLAENTANEIYGLYLMGSK